MSYLEYLELFQIPQRDRVSSKSQPSANSAPMQGGCFRYHKGTDFQANHNCIKCSNATLKVVLDTTKVQIFKQITTLTKQYLIDEKLFQIPQRYRFSSKSQHPHQTAFRYTRCFRYHKGTDFQANHNNKLKPLAISLLFQIPQRYRFSSKSQRYVPTYSKLKCCFRYHKGTDFQANHNSISVDTLKQAVVLDTTKVQIFKQITTLLNLLNYGVTLFQIPQRYRFSSKSQHSGNISFDVKGCFRYHKGTDFQANHNQQLVVIIDRGVVLDTTKVQIFKQITTKIHGE